MRETNDAGMPVQELARIAANDLLDGNLYLMTLAAPRIAAAVRPGQFIHLRIPGMGDHILRRPFGVYDRDLDAGTIDVLYQVVGHGTKHMSALCAGTQCDVMGPLGHGWSMPQGTTRALVVAGGAGAAPLYLFTGQLLESGVSTDVVLGAQTKGGLVMLERFEKLLGCAPACSTDDGTFGYAGFATLPAADLMRENDYDIVYCCGPEPLMRAVARLAQENGAACQVSLEKRMACGVGACLSCIVETTEGRKRSCVDGPVFPAEKVVWE